MFERYNEQARKAVFLARHEAGKFGSRELEIEHLLLGILHHDAGLASRLSLSTADINAIEARVHKDSEPKKALPTSADIPVSFSARRAFQYAAEEADRLQQTNIGPEHLLLGISREESSPAAVILRDYGLGPDRLRKEAAIRARVRTAIPMPASPFRDLVEEAGKGESGPLVGRERELEFLIQTLSRRTRNNAVLIGDAGVGKTAIVEGLAQRIAHGNVPAFLEHRRLLAIDASSLMLPSRGGLSRGEFGDVLAQVPQPAETIVFIRGLFNLAMAGSAWAVVEAMRAMEPQLAHNGLRCIATGSPAGLRATTEKATMLARRFEVIPVAPVNENDAIRILSSLQPKFERFHAVTFEESALATAVKASGHFLSSRHLPDRAIDLLDEAAAAVKLRRESERSPAPSTVTSEDIVSAVAVRAGVSAEAVKGVLDASAKSDFQAAVAELAGVLPPDVKEWLPYLVSYVLRCSPAEAEALSRAIISANRKTE